MSTRTRYARDRGFMAHAAAHKDGPKEPWTESVEEYKTRLKLCAAQINQKYDVDGLCRALPKRLKMLEERKGDRISK